MFQTIYSLELTELVTGSHVWICPNTLGAAIKDAENKSCTVLARSLICAFHSGEELLSKGFTELDKDIIEACVDKDMYTMTITFVLQPSQSYKYVIVQSVIG